MSEGFFSPPTPPRAPETPASSSSEPAPPPQDEPAESVPPAAVTPPSPPPATNTGPTPAPPAPSLAGLTPEDPSRQQHQKAKRTLLWLTLGIILLVVVGAFLLFRFWPQPAPAKNSGNQPAVTANTNKSTSSTPNLPVDPTPPAANFVNPDSGATPSVNSSGWPAITTNWVMNRRYPTPPPIYGRPDYIESKTNPVATFELKNGLAQFTLIDYRDRKKNERIKIKTIVFVRPEAVGTGDINGDGVADALTVLKWSENDGPSLPQMYTFLGTKPYEPFWVADAVMGNLGAVNWSATRITLSQGRAEVSVSYQKPEDQACCWTGTGQVNLKFNSGVWSLE